MMLQKTQKYMKQQHMAMHGEKIVLGLSGGMDSVCLFHVLRMLGYSLEVVHVNHGIRGEEADRDEAFVKVLCEKFQIPIHTFCFDVPAMSREMHLSMEEAGRMVRRQAFEKVRKETEAKYIALAHHGNDRAETFLFHLSRGTGIKGLSSMRPMEGVYIRPLLHAAREEIEMYMKQQGYEFVEDSTNASDDYTRNKIRHQLIPLLEELNSQSVGHICKAAEKLEIAAAFMEREAEKLFRLSAALNKEEVRVFKTAFEQGDRAIQIPVLQKCLEYFTGSLANITENHLKSLLELFSMQTGKELQLPDGICAARTYDGVRIFKKAEQLSFASVEVLGDGIYEFAGRIFQIGIEEWDVQKNFPIKTYTKYFDYDKISEKVFLRTRKTGDYLEINRDHGKKSLQDYLVNEKVPKEERDGVILLADGSHVIWVVGKRISEYYKVTDNTKKVLKIQMYGGKEDEFYSKRNDLTGSCGKQN